MKAITVQIITMSIPSEILKEHIFCYITVKIVQEQFRTVDHDVLTTGVGTRRARPYVNNSDGDEQRQTIQNANLSS